ERAHYELLAGDRRAAEQLLTAFESFASDTGLLPEQAWDSADIPERELFLGRAAGSAMPLVWAHAEYVKLRRSLRDQRVFDLPPQTVQRYLVEKVVARRSIWRFNHRIRALTCGMTLRVETLASAVVHWTSDNWTTAADVATRDTGLGLFTADLATAALPVGAIVAFTMYWPDAARWEGTNFTLTIHEGAA
ncbi:MAG: glucan 1,4-alpha-glucosidase, partial [Gemmatimonadota bacterium]